jgi:Flp pilus assembly protein TadB
MEIKVNMMSFVMSFIFLVGTGLVVYNVGQVYHNIWISLLTLTMGAFGYWFILWLCNNIVERRVKEEDAHHQE